MSPTQPSWRTNAENILPKTFNVLGVFDDHILAQSQDVVFVCDSATGASQKGAEYAMANGYKVISVPALNQATSTRNDYVLAIATHAVSFYDQHCSQTRKAIRQVKERGLPLRVINC